MSLSAERLREMLTYDRETGLFTWRKGHARAEVGTIAGCQHGNGYIQIMVDKRKLFAHRMAWLAVHGRWPDGQIDHINGNRSDNRLINLRLATATQNNANQARRIDNTSGYKGVSLHKRKGLWRASIRLGGRQKHLGYFPSGYKAHLAYVAAAEKAFGEFARAG